jgi:hypothetical protein
MTPSTNPEDAIRAWLLDSDRRDREQERLLNAWSAGWQACEAQHAEQYEEGFTDGTMALKHAQHQAHRLIRGDEERWGPGGREHFADPRPGDYTGGPVTPW